MKNSIKYLILTVFLLYILFPGCGKPVAEKPVILTTTSMLGVIVSEIAGENYRVEVIVPGGQCPGHFDLQPETIKGLNNGLVIFNHGYEDWLDKLLRAADTPPPVNTLAAEGNIMIPENHKRIADGVVAYLYKADVQNSSYYLENLKRYNEKINRVWEYINEHKAALQDLSAISSVHQSDFLTWLGVRVIARYDRAEDLNPRILSELTALGAEHGVALVVDNLQSGSDIGRGLAGELGAAHITLTNFPLDKDYPGTLMDNFDALLASLNEL